MAEQTDPSPTRLWTARTWPFVVSTLGLMTFIAFESFAVTTVLPVVAADFEATGWYSMAYAATITTALVGMVVGGNWADRSGTTVPLAVGGALFLLGIALCVLAPGMPTFIVGRLLQGLGGGIDSVIIYVLIARQLPAAVRPKMFGMLTAAWLLPAMLGPLAAGALTDLTSWRIVFGIVLVGAAGSLVSLLVVGRAPDGSPPNPAPPAVFGRRSMVAVAAAGGLLVLHVGGQRPPSQAVVALLIGLGIVVAAAAMLLPSGTLRLRIGAPRLVALRALLGATVAATDVYLTLYLQHQRGFAPTTAGLVIAIGAVGWAAGAWLQGRFPGGSDPDRRLIALAGPLVWCGPVGALLYTAALVPLGVVVGAGVLMGIGMGMAYPRISSATLTLASRREQGTVSSALQSGESMATAGFLAVTGTTLTLLPGDDGFLVVYLVIATVALFAAATGITTRRG